jgi:hypothetical protein
MTGGLIELLILWHRLDQYEQTAILNGMRASIPKS